MSGKAAWWTCVKGHSWKAEIAKRSAGSGCPYCDNQRVLEGFNDLKTLRPDLALQWDSEKNILAPSQVVAGSGKQAWWIRDNGHSWKAAILSRSKPNGNGCPYCANQRVISGFNDLHTLNPVLVKEWDLDKNVILSSQVTTGTTRKAWWKCSESHSWKAQIFSRNRGSRCPYCTGRLLLSGFNDLGTRRADLASEWDYDKNTLTPSQVSFGSIRTVWWRCDKGHSWKATVSSRGSIGIGRSRRSGCPYCAGKKVLIGFNDLKTLNPKLADEWDPDKNTLTPSQVTVASGKSVWWKCKRGHSWRTNVASRSVSGNNCPYCSGLYPYTPRCVK